MAKKAKNSIIKTSFNVWIRLLFASIMCFIVWFSIDAMGVGFFSEVTGYQIYEYDENGENPRLIVSHTYTDGEDRSQEIDLKENQKILAIREMSQGEKATIGIVSSIFTLLIFGVFPYNFLWNMGNHDENFVHLKRMQKDIHFGLKAGAVASVPSAILYLLLIFGKFGIVPGVIIKYHRLINAPFIPYIDAIEAGAASADELSIGSLLAVGAILLFVPAVCWLGYYLGYRQISIRDKIIYKKPADRK